MSIHTRRGEGPEVRHEKQAEVTLGRGKGKRKATGEFQVGCGMRCELRKENSGFIVKKGLGAHWGLG